MATTKEIQVEDNIKTVEQKLTLNYEQAKKKYFYLLEKYIGQCKVPMCTRQEIEERIKLIQTNPIMAKKYSQLTTRKTDDGKNKLYRIEYWSKYLEIIPVEDAFDVLMDTHVACDHSNPSAMYKKLSNEYLVPKFCVNWVFASCNVCNPSDVESDKLVEEEVVESLSKKPPRRGLWRMNVISEDSIVENSGRASFLLILKEDDTNFVVLRPLYESSEGLALEIFKLFTEFGYPERVYVPNLLPFYKNILNLVYLINSVVVVPVEQVTDDNDIFERDEAEVLVELKHWMEMTKDYYWEQGCHIVQHKLNTTEKPFTRLFDKEKFVGIPFHQFFEHRYCTKVTWIQPPYLEIQSKPEDSSGGAGLVIDNDL